MKALLQIFFISICICCRSFADVSLTLAWDANSEPDVAAYVVYYGLTSRNYPNATNVGNVTTATIHGLLEDQDYYFAITAVSGAGLGSAFSAEITNMVCSVIKYVTLTVQESIGIQEPWTNIWSIDRLVQNTNCLYRVFVSLPSITNTVALTNGTSVDTNEVPPFPP